MYASTPELAVALENLEIDYEAFVNTSNGAESGVSGFSFWNLVNEGAIAGAATAGFLVGGPLGALLAGALTAREGIAGTLGELDEVLENASSIFTLEPIRAALADNIDPARVANSGMQLRLAAVALEDGLLYYITEAGELIRNSARNPDWSEAITDGDGLIRGVLASAAFPGSPAPRIRPRRAHRDVRRWRCARGVAGPCRGGARGAIDFQHHGFAVGARPAEGFTGSFKLPKIALTIGRTGRERGGRRRNHSAQGFLRRPRAHFDRSLDPGSRHNGNQSRPDSHQHGLWIHEGVRPRSAARAATSTRSSTSCGTLSPTRLSPTGSDATCWNGNSHRKSSQGAWVTGMDRAGCARSANEKIASRN